MSKGIFVNGATRDAIHAQTKEVSNAVHPW